MTDRNPSRQVELLVPARTLLKLAVFRALVALAIIALEVLLSFFVAVLLALGLDPVVAALVKRGWKRAPAARWPCSRRFSPRWR